MGPITRTVTDGALMLSVLARPDRRDFTAAPAAVQGIDYRNGLDAGIDGVRIAYSRTLGPHGWADPDVAAAVERAAGTLADRQQEHTPELQSLMRSTSSVLCLKK